jgi:hypothetical protein
MYRVRPGRSRIACSIAACLACGAFGARNTELMPGRLIGSAPRRHGGDARRHAFIDVAACHRNRRLARKPEYGRSGQRNGGSGQPGGAIK